MAHFAKLDGNNVVTDIVVVKNDELVGSNGTESEINGIAFCKATFGEETNWVQTSYNSTFRKRYAVIGGFYYPPKDAFVGKQPFPSWSFNPETVDWEAPVPMPSEGGPYIWDESTLTWAARNHMNGA